MSPYPNLPIFGTHDVPFHVDISDSSSGDFPVAKTMLNEYKRTYPSLGIYHPIPPFPFSLLYIYHPLVSPRLPLSFMSSSLRLSPYTAIGEFPASRPSTRCGLVTRTLRPVGPVSIAEYFLLFFTATLIGVSSSSSMVSLFLLGFDCFSHRFATAWPPSSS